MLTANELPNGYKNISLGMTLEETKKNLLKEPDFGYHGDRDVSLVPGADTVLIETDTDKGFGSAFLTRCWFQFTSNKLFIITININPEKMDYYSIFTKLKEKYGEPNTFDPQSATWKNDEVTMSLEKPLTLKYVDNKLFNETQRSIKIQKSALETTQEMFLDEL
ncbi:MAG: hypothetical protein J6X84_08170 [Treponema sp.]|nr:hypothetical protein [Treponema sp.]